MENKQDNDIMTVDDVAVYLSLHRQTVYDLANEGKIPAWKVGGSWRFSKAAIDANFKMHNLSPKPHEGTDNSSGPEVAHEL
jgi:excisionase family DNA binding protein